MLKHFLDFPCKHKIYAVLSILILQFSGKYFYIQSQHFHIYISIFFHSTKLYLGFQKSFFHKVQWRLFFIVLNSTAVCTKQVFNKFFLVQQTYPQLFHSVVFSVIIRIVVQLILSFLLVKEFWRFNNRAGQANKIPMTKFNF